MVKCHISKETPLKEDKWLVTDFSKWSIFYLYENNYYMYNHVSDFPNIYSTFRCCKIYIPIEEEQYDQTSDIVLTDVSLSLECQEDEDAYNAGDQGSSSERKTFIFIWRKTAI